MITLDNINKSLELVLGSAPVANQPDYVVGYVDIGTTPFSSGGNDGLLTGSTAVTAVSAPGASVQRQIQNLSVYNLDTAVVLLTAQLNNNGTKRTLWKGPLLPGESLNYTNGRGFYVLNASGIRMMTGAVAGVSSEKVIEASMKQQVLRSRQPAQGSTFITSGTAYWNYLGKTISAITIKYVEFHVTVVGVGTQTAEVALVSTPSAPNKASQTMTLLIANGTLDSLLVGTGVKRNTSSLAYTVAAGVHLWAGFRQALATTQATIRTIGYDHLGGNLMITSSAGALTAGGPWTGIRASTLQSPDLRATLD